jgi:hypothetical protein
MAWGKQIALELLGAWNWFWFDSRRDGDLVPLSLFRLTFCFVMLICYFTRAFDVEFFYSVQGILPGWHAQNVDFFRFHPTFITDAWSPFSLHLLHSFFLLTLLSLALGFYTRISAVLVYVLHMAFINRNMSVMFGVDMIATFFLLYLCFANSNARFSLDSWRGRGAIRQSGLSHLAFRLMQVQLCVIYAFSGWEKLKGTRWWDGSAIWDVLSIGNMQRWDLSFVAHFPILLSTAVYVVLLFEIYFPVLVWLRRWRLPLLAFGVQMHIGIFVFMNLPSFGFMMISLYALFLNPEEVNAGVRFFQQRLRLTRPSRS